MHFDLKNISVIIPTYNRPDDVMLTLKSFSDKIDLIGEVLVIDQSGDNKTKKVLDNLKNKKIKHFFLQPPSLTKARNLGISLTSKKSKIILFLDDDVSLEHNYFEEILRVFKENENCVGATGYYLQKGKKIGKIETVLRKFFFIEHQEKNRCEVASSYGAIYPSEITKIIKCQWLPGFNMAFRKDIIGKESFDENLTGYALAEDFDFTYRLYKKGFNLYMNPRAKLVHRVSNVERYPTKKIAFVNQINHFYLHFKNFCSFKENIVFFWCLFGIFLLRSINLPVKRNEISLVKLRLFIVSSLFCFANLNFVKNGYLDYLYKKAKI